MRSPKSNPKPSPEPRYAWQFGAIGTQWFIAIYQDCDAGAIERQLAARIDGFDATYSRFRPDSLVTAISKRPDRYRFPPGAAKLFDLYRRLYDATGGLVTPLIGGQLSDAGYDADYSLRPGKLRPEQAWNDVMRFDGGTLTTSEPLLLDFGAAGKGYLVDILYEEIKAAGIDSFLIDASGDMRVRGVEAPLRVGMEQPDTDRVIGVIELSDQALCASAPNRRSWEGYHHVLNPRTGRSPAHIAAVWVVAEDCATADGLTTALFFCEPEQLSDSFTFEHAVLYADSSIKSSPGFPAELFTTGDPNHAEPATTDRD